MRCCDLYPQLALGFRRERIGSADALNSLQWSIMQGIYFRLMGWIDPLNYLAHPLDFPLPITTPHGACTLTPSVRHYLAIEGCY